MMNMKQNLSIVFFKVYAELKLEFSMSFLGLAWWVLEPLIYLGSFYLIFAVGLRQGGEGYVAFLLCGLVSWKWFAATVTSSSIAISCQFGLIQQVYFPKVLLPLIVVLSNFLKFLIILVLLLVFLVYAGVSPSFGWIYLPLVIIVQLCWITALAFLLSAVVPLIPDLKLVINQGMIVLMFASGIYFDLQNISERVRYLFYMNPMAHIIDSYRKVLIEGVSPDIVTYAVPLCASIVVGLVGIVVLRSCDRYYAKVLV